MRKNILFIGGSYGIGLESAKILTSENNLFIASRTKEGLNEIECTHLTFDASKDDIKELELPDTLDGLVYFPGSIKLKPFKMLSPEIFQEEMNLNFFSLVKVVQGLLPKLKNSEQASLIFFSTVAVKVGMPFHTSISAAKGAIEGFAKSLAAEYAPSFRVNVISPSLTDTQLSEKLLSNDAKREKMGDRHPLKRVGNPKDIANAVEFLISEKSSWMTGQILGIDGGLSTLNVH
ncbi:NAD(P)-dependent dehydrogenase (short-subunit alcohol dehydrogenase family) [Gillisia mitskevichiae]|uniref:NAD(P)-dependent dehydrogenase (Short-subunit alcohol dehydrogenase family) n=1 Tax=Gillisia mitskevichiae TaxID=270921 RepID=A0A495PTR4_9FLAO|nr:SDR family oxidoreductase [Gillisia mitskevichiae]RKS52932.1 NAD(P)-dependent dehydrogenase (short-subunit alcohol dehydrogenase family) [Gillisia mitskevichiae]